MSGYIEDTFVRQIMIQVWHQLDPYQQIAEAFYLEVNYWGSDGPRVREASF